MKMGRRRRCSSVTYRLRYAPLLAPCRRPILIATKHMLFRGQDTRGSISEQQKQHSRKASVWPGVSIGSGRFVQVVSTSPGCCRTPGKFFSNNVARLAKLDPRDSISKKARGPKTKSDGAPLL